MFQDGTSPTNMLTFWARDRVRGPRLTVEHAVQKQARDTAYLYGLFDRGTLEVGKRADLAVWDVSHPDYLSYWIGGHLLRGRITAGSYHDA